MGAVVEAKRAPQPEISHNGSDASAELRVRAVEFADVSGGYRRKEVLHEISFTLREGEMVSVIGPNGSGKTTVLRALTGLLEQVKGRVRLFGRDVHSISAVQRAALVGVVPQKTFMPMAYRVEEVVAMGRSYAVPRWRGLNADDRAVIERAMEYTDVAGLRQSRFPELSGGEQQRVIIAMVLAQQPRIIIMDEATSHLDINHSLEIMQLVERLNQDEGVTVLTVSHDLNLSSEFCQRLLLMDGGRLVADGSPQDVLTEAMLQEVYHCRAKIERNPHSGAVMVVPELRAQRPVDA
jgi:iron complex transport system ATP-binding protein